MTGSRWLTALLVVAALAAAGCGGDDEDESTGGGETATDTAPAETGTQTESAPAESAGQGRELFATTCGGCHTLKAADTSGTTGPNLDDLKPDEARVKSAIEEGPSIMPAGLLEGAEADAVAKFVAENAGG